MAYCSVRRMVEVRALLPIFLQEHVDYGVDQYEPGNEFVNFVFVFDPSLHQS